MNIQEFNQEYDSLTLERRRNFANRLMNEVTKRINQEFKENGDSLLFEDIIPILEGFEAEDYFGTEGFDG